MFVTIFTFGCSVRQELPWSEVPVVDVVDWDAVFSGNSEGVSG